MQGSSPVLKFLNSVAFMERPPEQGASLPAGKSGGCSTSACRCSTSPTLASSAGYCAAASGSALRVVASGLAILGQLPVLVLLCLCGRSPLSPFSANSCGIHFLPDLGVTESGGNGILGALPYAGTAPNYVEYR